MRIFQEDEIFKQVPKMVVLKINDSIFLNNKNLPKTKILLADGMFTLATVKVK